MIDDVETPVWGESPVFGEIQDDGSAVDAEADVFDGIVGTIRERFCLDSVRRGWSGIPVHRYVAGMVNPRAPLGGSTDSTGNTGQPFSWVAAGNSNLPDSEPVASESAASE